MGVLVVLGTIGLGKSFMKRSWRELPHRIMKHGSGRRNVVNIVERKLWVCVDREKAKRSN